MELRPHLIPEKVYEQQLSLDSIFQAKCPASMQRGLVSRFRFSRRQETRHGIEPIFCHTPESDTISFYSIFTVPFEVVSIHQRHQSSRNLPQAAHISSSTTISRPHFITPHGQEHTASPTQQSAHTTTSKSAMSDNKAIIHSRPVQKPICIYAGVIGTIGSVGVEIPPTASIATLLDCLQRQLIRRSLPHEFTAYTTKRGDRWMTSDEHWSIIYNSSALKAKYICPWAKLDPTLTVGDYFVDPPVNAHHIILEWTAGSLAQRAIQVERARKMAAAFRRHELFTPELDFIVEWERLQAEEEKRKRSAPVVRTADVVVATRRAATVLLGQKIDKNE